MDGLDTFKNVLGLSFTMWDRGNDDEEHLLDLEYSGPTDELRLHKGICSLNLTEELEFLYISDSTYQWFSSNTDIKPPFEKVEITYNRNIQRFFESSVNKVDHSNNMFILSSAGSKTPSEEDVVYQYPYLLFNLPLNHNISYFDVNKSVCDAFLDDSFISLRDPLISLQGSEFTELVYADSPTELVSFNKYNLDRMIRSYKIPEECFNQSVLINPHFCYINGIYHVLLSITEGNKSKHLLIKPSLNIVKDK
jgi:hypothetical protein